MVSSWTLALLSGLLLPASSQAQPKRPSQLLAECIREIENVPPTDEDMANCRTEVGSFVEGIENQNQQRMAQLDLVRSAAFTAFQACVKATEGGGSRLLSTDGEGVNSGNKRRLMTEAQVNTCKTAAADAVSEITGKEVTAGDLMKMIEQGLGAEVAGKLQACAQEAEVSGVQSCVDSIKSEIQNSEEFKAMFPNAGEGDLQQVLTRAAESRMQAMRKQCEGDEGCNEKLKALQAAVQGREIGDINDVDLQRQAMEEIRRAAGEALSGCMAEDGATLEACKNQLSQMIEDMTGKPVPEERLRHFMKLAQEYRVQEIWETCTESEAACRQKAQEAMETMSGKVLSRVEMAKAENGAALKEAQAALAKCAEEEDMQCDAAFEIFEKMGGRGDVVRNDMQEKIAKRKMRNDVVAAQIKEAVSMCIDLPTDAEIENCRNEVVVSVEATLQTMAPGMPEVDRKKRVGTMLMRAAAEAFCDSFSNCFEAEGSDAAAVTTCKEQTKAKKEKVEGALGVKLPSNCNSEKAREAAQACVDAPEGRKACLKAQEDALVESGMKRREMAMKLKMGILRTVAELLAACLEEEVAENECVQEAKDKFIELTGKPESVFEDHKEKVVKVAKAIKDNIPTIIRLLPSVEVSIGWNGNCSTEDSDDASDTLTAAADSVTSPGQLTATKDVCVIVDDEVTHIFKIDVSSMANDADGLIDFLDDLIEELTPESSQRRLSVSESVYASQEEEEVPQDTGDDDDDDDDDHDGHDHDDDDTNEASTYLSLGSLTIALVVVASAPNSIV